jgi:MFS family permease
MAPSNQPNSLENQTNSSPNRTLSIALWVFSAIYIYILLLSPSQQLLPGEPIWDIQPETFTEIVNESLNFFFLLPFLNAVGIHYMESPVVHPSLEALFNFAEAWIFMFLPLLLADRRGQPMAKIIIWSLAMFLTNTFLAPYMAALTMSEPAEENDMAFPKTRGSKGWLAKIFGVTGLIIGIISIAWAVMGRPEFGTVAERGQFFIQSLMSDRLTVAFCVDVILFGIFQAMLIGNIEPPDSNKRWLRFFRFGV